MEFDSKFCFPCSCMIFSIIHEQFWIKYWQRQGCTNPKVQAWGNVQDICCHDLCCCFVDFQYLNFPFACASRFKLDQDNLKNFLFPSLCGVHGWSHPWCPLASMDEVIYCASGPPSCMASMDEVPSHSASGPLLPLLPGCFKMDQDSYSKLMAS